MLEGLNHVPWERLEHAYGPASDVPAQIRALASPDPGVRDQAYRQLWSNITHQGTVYSATAYAVPFLIELLETPHVAEKPVLLTLLNDLAYSSSYHDAHQDLFADMGVFVEEMQQPEWQLQIQEELQWVQAARDAVVAGAATYLALLDHADPEIRWSAGYVLSTCRARAREVVPAVQRSLSLETDDRVQASLLLCLGFLCTIEETAIFQDWESNAVVAPLPRVAAAISWLRVANQAAAPSAIAVLTQALTNPQPLDERYLPLPWSGHESIVAVLSDALGHLGPGAATFVVPQVLHALAGIPAKDMGSISMVSLILFLSFRPRKEPWAIEELTDFQRSILTQLLQCERAWDWANVYLQFRGYGLPDNKKKLKEFLQL